jgi:zeaxanthin glucosyltransferase
MVSDNRVMKVLIPSPPFWSHFKPLLSLAVALLSQGAEPVIACDDSFAEETRRRGIRFLSLRINRNANTGSASLTSQGGDEQRRLKEFLLATRVGAAETLMVQAGHRMADMLPDPAGLARDLLELNNKERPDLWIVDQLSYGVTLALTGMQVPFATFCAPHPHSIPGPGELFGVPRAWPAAIEIGEEETVRLHAAAEQTDRLFTAEFNQVLKRLFNAPPVESAFRHASKESIIFNYPGFDSEDETTDAPRRFFSGHSAESEKLPRFWESRKKEDRERILIVLGTFLSSRYDVLEKLIIGMRRIHPRAELIVGAGDSVPHLEHLKERRTHIEQFIPQRALLSSADLVIHHGGVGSFTETLRAGKPAVVLPFSSDQFDVAVDVEKQQLGCVLDPNHFTFTELQDAVNRAQGSQICGNAVRLAGELSARGPEWAAAKLLCPGGR